MHSGMWGLDHDGIQFASFCSSPIQFDACSLVCSHVLLIFFLMLLLIPRTLHIVHTDRPMKHLQPISIGAHNAFHPLFLHSDCRSSYLVFISFKVASILSSHGTVNLIRMACLDAVDHITMSGLSVV